jgi:sugar phosphate isomerase/epimerase
VFVSRREEKLDLLMASLKQAVGMMPDENLPDARFAIALELEPGRVYVLNEFNWLKEACARIRADGLLARHVGVNLDLAHARIAGVQPGDLAGLEDRLVHAHIADHPPAMHTRDQALGAWTALDQGGGSYRPFLQILARRPSQSGLPFSRAVALELEGAHRMKWIRDSIAGLRHLLTACR